MNGMPTERRWRSAGIHHDLTPMVDVAMLLLTFFMLTAIVHRPQIMELSLPREKVPVARSSVISLQSDAAGVLTIRMGDEAPFPATVPGLRSLLKAAGLRARRLMVIVSVHRSAPYQSLIDILDEIGQADISRFAVVPYDIHSSTSQRTIASDDKRGADMNQNGSDGVHRLSEYMNGGNRSSIRGESTERKEP